MSNEEFRNKVNVWIHNNPKFKLESLFNSIKYLNDTEHELLW